MAKIGRNSPCPCGSGKKYKKCCLGRTDEFSILDPEKFIPNLKTLKRAARIKQCLHPNTQECSENIVSAHSIQNSRILKHIASNGEVYMPCPKNDNPFESMTKYGRREATVFSGFCGYHDKVVFQPIEDAAFEQTTEQIFLYTYRCFSREYHKKQEAVNLRKELIKRAPSLTSSNSIGMDLFSGMEMAIKDLEHEKKEFDKALLSKDYDILTSVVWEFPDNIRFAGSGFEAPSTDLRGNKLQDLLDPTSPARHIFVIVFPEGEGSVCIISWLRANDDFFKNYKKQLENLTQEQRKNYINNTLPIISENTVVNPDAWDAWEEAKKEQFLSLIWEMATLTEEMGYPWDRLEKTLYDLFEL